MIHYIINRLVLDHKISFKSRSHFWCLWHLLSKTGLWIKTGSRSRVVISGIFRNLPGEGWMCHIINNKKTCPEIHQNYETNPSKKFAAFLGNLLVLLVLDLFIRLLFMSTLLTSVVYLVFNIYFWWIQIAFITSFQSLKSFVLFGDFVIDFLLLIKLK